MDKTEILLRLFHFFSGVIRSRYQDKTEILLRLFHFFSGVIRPFLDCLHRKKSFMF